MHSSRHEPGEFSSLGAPCEPDSLEQGFAMELGRVPAPAGFADKVMQRITAQQPAWRPPWTWAIAAVLLLVFLAAAEQWHVQRQNLQASVTSRQFALAMRLTHAALLHAGQRLDRNSADSPDHGG